MKKIRFVNDIASMNARKKEKEKLFKNARKPSTLSEFVYLSEKMMKWFQDHPDTKNFLCFVYQNGYSWSEFKNWRKESEIFCKAIETCVQMCAERRERYLDARDKLSQVYLREQPLYNPMLSDYEKEMKEKGEEISESQKRIHEEIVKKILDT